MAAKLRAVDKAERAKVPIKSVTEALRRGSKRDVIQQLTLGLARSFDGTDSARDRGQLARFIVELVEKLEADMRTEVEEAVNNAVSKDEPWNAAAI